MNKMLSKRSHYFVLLTGVVAIFLYFVTLTSYNFLLPICNGLDKSSKTYEIVLEAIFKLPNQEQLTEHLMANLEKGNKNHLHNLYVQLLGYAGSQQASSILLRRYVDLQNATTRQSTVNYIVDSLGLIGSQQAIPVLEKLLLNYDKHQPLVTEYSIARALYLLTGKRYYYHGNKLKAQITLTPDLIKARQLIIETRTRPRTANEVLFFAKLYSP